MISIENKHLVLRPKTDSTMGYHRLLLLSAYVCPLCSEVVHAAARLEPGQDIPKLSLYHEGQRGLTVSYHSAPLNPPNGERGVLWVENGHNRPGKLSDSGCDTSGRCGVTKLIIEPGPLRRVLQFLRILGVDFPLSKPRDNDTVIPWLERHPELVDLVEDELSKKGSVLMPDRVGGPVIAYALRYHAWSNWALIRAVRAIGDQALAAQQEARDAVSS
jgi:hypothetical protein